MCEIFFLTPFLTFAPRKTVKKLALRSKPDKKVSTTSGKLGNLKKSIRNHAASPKSLIRGSETNITSLRQFWDFFFKSHSTYGTWKNGQKVSISDFCTTKNGQKTGFTVQPDKKVRTSGKLGNLKKTIRNHAASPKSLIRGSETNI